MSCGNVTFNGILSELCELQARSLTTLLLFNEAIEVGQPRVRMDSSLTKRIHNRASSILLSIKNYNGSNSRPLVESTRRKKK
jgi:hypothetical protein